MGARGALTCEPRGNLVQPSNDFLRRAKYQGSLIKITGRPSDICRDNWNISSIHLPLRETFRTFLADFRGTFFLSFFLPRYFFQLDKIEELCCSSRDRETKCLYRRFAFLSKETFDLSEFTYFTINWKIPSSNVFSLFLQVFVHFVSINIKYFQAWS